MNIIPIDSIKSLYNCKGSFQNAKSFLKYVNKLLELEPIENIYTEHYFNNNNFTKIVCAMVEGKSYSNVKQLSSKIGNLTGIVQRTLKHNETNMLSNFVKQLQSSTTPLNMEVKPILFTAEPWTDLVMKFKDILQDKYALNNCKVVCVCYLHEYVLRISEIFHTTVQPVDGFNHLNLKDLTWTINVHKNFAKDLKPRVFNITQEFADDIKQLLSPHSIFIIHKANYSPYSSAFVHSTVSMPASIPCNSEVRNSFEEWHYKDSKKNLDYVVKYSENVLGHCKATVDEYYTKNDTVLAINDQLLQNKRRVVGYCKTTGDVLGFYRWF